MFHLLANFVAIDATVNMDVPALNDGIMNIQNGHHIPPEDLQLVAAYSSAVTLLRTQLNNPRTRQVTPSQLDPVGNTLLPANNPPIAMFLDNPFTLRAQEEIVYQSTDSAAGPNNHYIVTWLRRMNVVSPTGDIFTLRGVGATTVVASTWTPATVTWDQQLPAGRYACVGGKVVSATGIAFQLTFDNQFWRPGGLAVVGAGTREPAFQRRGGLGVWGYFNTVTMPRLTMLCNAADTAQTVYLDLIKIG